MMKRKNEWKRNDIRENCSVMKENNGGSEENHRKMSKISNKWRRLWRKPKERKGIEWKWKERRMAKWRNNGVENHQWYICNAYLSSKRRQHPLIRNEELQWNGKLMEEELKALGEGEWRPVCVMKWCNKIYRMWNIWKKRGGVKANGYGRKWRRWNQRRKMKWKRRRKKTEKKHIKKHQTGWRSSALINA